jgi:hypothetical protein
MVATRTLTSLAVLTLTASLGAQVLPKDRTFDVMVADSDGDRVVRLSDRTQNGLFQFVPNEYAVVYDGAVALGPLLSTPASLAFDSNGRLYVADSGTDVILTVIDYDGNGDAHSQANGEFQVFLDGNNFLGLALPSILKIAFAADGWMWGVNSGAGVAPLDFVFRCRDLNGDLDANDAGELEVWYDNASSSIAINTPFGLAIDPVSGDVFVSDVNPDGIYRMTDLNGDSDFNDSGEVVFVFSGPAGGPLLSNANTLRFHPNGDLFYNDATTDQIVRLHDGNGNGHYDDPGEATVFADKTGNPLGVPANHFDIEIDENGRIFAVENSAYDAVIRYQDLNGDFDAQDPGEVVKVYDSAIGPGAIGAPRSLALVPAPYLTTPTPTVQVGSNLVLDMACAELDQFTMLFGVVPLGFTASIPPFGYLGFVPAVILPFGTVPGSGNLSLPFAVPAGVPTPVAVSFAFACGKAPFRTYLTNEVTIDIVP